MKVEWLNVVISNIIMRCDNSNWGCQEPGEETMVINKSHRYGAASPQNREIQSMLLALTTYIGLEQGIQQC